VTPAAEAQQQRLEALAGLLGHDAGYLAHGRSFLRRPIAAR
jgi:hypothetical protein